MPDISINYSEGVATEVPVGGVAAPLAPPAPDEPQPQPVEPEPEPDEYQYQQPEQEYS